MKTTLSKLYAFAFLALLLPSCAMPGGGEMMWIALVALLLFGGAKLPGLMRGLGQGVNELKKGLKEGESSDDKKALDGDDDKSGKPEA